MRKSFDRFYESGSCLLTLITSFTSRNLHLSQVHNLDEVISIGNHM